VCVQCTVQRDSVIVVGTVKSESVISVCTLHSVE